VRAFSAIKKKIAGRRTDTDSFYESYSKEKGQKTWNEYRVLLSEDLNLRDEHKDYLYDAPLVPLECTVSTKQERTKKHLDNKLKDAKTLHIDAIARSSISTYAIYTQLAGKRGGGGGNKVAKMKKVR
jgi:hypothetical protein